MLDSDRDATIAQFLRWSHDTVGEANELMSVVRSDAEAAGVNFDDAELFQELVLGLDRFVSGIKGIYEKIGVSERDDDGGDALPSADDGAERAA
jgi:hypothetical protein